MKTGNICYHIATLVFVGALVACSSDSPAAAPLPATMALLAGDAQTAVVGTTVSPVSVVVKNGDGTPVVNDLVRWTVVSGGGTLSADSTYTDANGVANVTWTLGTVSGTDSLEAKLNGTSLSVVVTAVANPDAAVALVKVSGDGQVAADGTPAPQPLVVKAVDQYGNGVSGVTITWTAGASAQLTATSSVTGADGTASDTFVPEVGSVFEVDARLAANSGVEVAFSEAGQ